MVQVSPVDAPLETSDPLSDIADSSGLRCAGVERWNLKAPWGVRYHGSTRAMVHCVIQGQAVLAVDKADETKADETKADETKADETKADETKADETKADETKIIPQGGSVILPHGVPHTIASAWPLDATFIVDAARDQPEGSVCNVGDPVSADTVLLTMPFSIPGRVGECDTHSLRDQSRVLAVGGEDLLELTFLCAKLVLMPGLGDRYVVRRLSEAVLALLLQRLAGSREDTLGLFSMFASAGVRAALKAVDGDIAHPWTVGELAEIAGLPRAAFKTEFLDVVGTNINEYVCLRRVRQAESVVATGAATLADAAVAAGFRSKASFANALKRVSGGRARGFLSRS